MAGVSESADDDLPSVMTCANYLKLPPYSTKVSGDCFLFDVLIKAGIVETKFELKLSYWLGIVILICFTFSDVTGSHVQETAICYK